MIAIENTERAVRRLVDRLGGPDGLAVAYEAGPCGYDLFRLLTRIGRGVRRDRAVAGAGPGRRPGQDRPPRRQEAGAALPRRRADVRAPPSPEQEGLRDLVRCRDDLRRARTAARHRVAKQLLRHGHIYREGKKAWTKQHRGVGSPPAARRPARPARAESHARAPRGVDAQLAAIEHELEQVAHAEPWCDPVRWLCSFRGIGLLTALGLLAEIGDFRRFATRAS